MYINSGETDNHLVTGISRYNPNEGFIEYVEFKSFNCLSVYTIVASFTPNFTPIDTILDKFTRLSLPIRICAFNIPPDIRHIISNIIVFFISYLFNCSTSYTDQIICLCHNIGKTNLQDISQEHHLMNRQHPL